MYRVRAYMDGFNLYYGIHTAFGRKYLWLDLERLTGRLLRSGQQLDLVYYFTAPIRDDSLGERRQDTYLQALSVHCQRLAIVKGRFQQKIRMCHDCGTIRVAYEEKETDVSIAVALVEDAARASYDTAIVVSGDSDRPGYWN